MQENQQVLIDLISRYYGDSEFRADLMRSPTKVLREEGVSIPEGTDVKLTFNRGDVLHIVFPFYGEVASRQAVSDDALATVVGGASSVGDMDSVWLLNIYNADYYSAGR